MIKFISALLITSVLSSQPAIYKQELGQHICLSSQQRDLDINDKVYISIEFSITIEDFKQHQYFVNAITAAIAEWAKYLPIRTTFYFEGMTILGVQVVSTEDRVNVIEIRFEDLQSSGYDDKIIGIWLPTQQRIAFDTDYFQKNPEEIYSVALHELGHLFGLPHIVNKHELGYTGYLVLQSGDARNYVMYPTSFDDRPQNTLSQIEIDFARHQAMFIFSIDHLSRQSECKIAVDN